MRFVLLPALALFSLSAQAQPTLTSANNIQAGTTYTAYNATNALPQGAAGANVTWDFSSLSSSASTNYGYYTCGSTGHSCTTFPGSTIVNDPGTGQYVYYKTSSSSLALNGISTGSVNFIYSDPQEILRFPFTYNNTYTDNFSSAFTSGGFPFTRSGTITVTADGYGTLKLPGGTYHNVLRVKKVENYTDTWSGPSISYSAETYTWYSPYLKELLANIVTTTISGSAGQPMMQYTSQPTTGIGGISAIDGTVSIFPNPAHERINAGFSLTEATNISAVLTDITGRIVRQIPATNYNQGRHQITMDTDGLTNGLYLLKIASGEEVITSKINVL